MVSVHACGSHIFNASPILSLAIVRYHGQAVWQRRSKTRTLSSMMFAFVLNHAPAEHVIIRTGSRLGPSQWETSLQSNAVSHWLGTNLESALHHYVKTTSFWCDNDVIIASCDHWNVMACLIHETGRARNQNNGVCVFVYVQLTHSRMNTTFISHAVGWYVHTKRSTLVEHPEIAEWQSVLIYCGAVSNGVKMCRNIWIHNEK